VDGAHIAIVAAPRSRAAAAGRPRVGIIPGRGLRGAVERNRVRRRIRAALGTVDLAANAVDMIVIARSSVCDVAFAALCDDLRGALGRIGR